MNLVLGPIIVAISVGVLYLFFTVINVMPRLVVFGVVLGMPVGIVLTATLFANECRACACRLKSLPDPHREFEYCPRCRAVAIHRVGRRRPTVLHGAAAQSAIEERLAEGLAPTVS
jgi:hypothetical protein